MDKIYKLQVRLSQKNDADILEWLSQQANQSEAVRRALRAAISPNPSPTLGAIRSVVEAALEQKLANLATVSNATAPTTDDKNFTEDPELGAALDSMFD